MSYQKKNIILIGSGPASLSMSATMSMANIEHIVLEKEGKPGGMLPEIHNELDDFVTGLYKNGLELTEKIEDFVQKYQLPIKYNSKVININTDKKTISYLYKGILKEINYDYAVIATGSRFNIDNKSIDTEFDKDIYYRISYKLKDFINKKVAVIGSGDNATIAALRLTEYASGIYLVNKSENWKSRKDLVEEVLNHPEILVLNHKTLTGLNGDSSLRSIEIKDIITDDKDIIEIDKVVFKIGYLPNSDFISGGIELDEKGYIKISGRYETSAKNVFAIGDIVSSAYKRISIAMGHGTELGNYFLKELL
jgi:thioredoxin reductase